MNKPEVKRKNLMSEPSEGKVELPTREGYDRWATIYDDEDNPVVVLEHGHVERIMTEVRGLRVLDAGCGTGRHALLLARAGADVTAVDFSAAMLANARSKPGADAIKFLQHDLETGLPFSDDAFDCVISGLVVDHITDLVGYFSELRRVCYPGGWVVITVMHPALMLLGTQARFTDPETGTLTLPASQRHQLSDYVMGALEAGFSIQRVSEHLVDEALVTKSERARRYLGWPMLLLLQLTPRGQP